MLVRIRFGRGAQLADKPRKNRRIALAFAAFLTPAAALTMVLALWPLAADLGWANNFVIASGFFSHWQVWMGAAVVLQFFAHLLNRYGRGRQSHASG